MTLRHIKSLLAALVVCAGTCSANADVFQFDLGHNTQETPNTTTDFWNNLTGGNGAIPADLTNVVTSTGAVSAVDLLYSETNGSDSGVAGTARTISSFPASLAGLPASALQDPIFSRDSPVAFTFDDLDSTLTYDLDLYGSTNLAGLSVYTVTDAGVPQAQTVDTFNNNTTVASFTGLVPDADGEITIDLTSDNTTDPEITRGFAVLNTIILTSNAASIPEPSSLAILGLGLTGVLVRRRK